MHTSQKKKKKTRLQNKISGTNWPTCRSLLFHFSLKNMFASPQFEDNLSSFQKLLAEGVFDLSFSSVKAEEYSTLNRLALCNLTKSKWVEQYNLLKV